MVGGAHMALAHRGPGGGGEDPSEESVDAATEEADGMLGRRGCCCIRLPRFGSSRSVPGGEWERIGDGAPQGAGTDAAGSAGAAWWRRALMRVREWSEIVAGPRWKTFIRRVNRNHRWGGGGGGGGAGGLCGIGNGGGGGGGAGGLCGIGSGGGGGGAGGLCGIGGGGARSGKFQYDPMSYALNFDEGHGTDDDTDGDYGYRNFSARYVLPPSLAKTSMDVGGRDAPTPFPAT